MANERPDYDFYLTGKRLQDHGYASVEYKERSIRSDNNNSLFKTFFLSIEDMYRNLTIYFFSTQMIFGRKKIKNRLPQFCLETFVKNAINKRNEKNVATSYGKKGVSELILKIQEIQESKKNQK